MSHILLKKSHTAPRTVYHKPSDDDPSQPKCHIAGEFIRKESDVIHGLRCCKECSGEATEPEQGAKLCNQIEGLWSEGGSA